MKTAKKPPPSPDTIKTVFTILLLIPTLVIALWPEASPAPDSGGISSTSSSQDEVTDVLVPAERPCTVVDVVGLDLLTAMRNLENSGCDEAQYAYVNLADPNDEPQIYSSWRVLSQLPGGGTYLGGTGVVLLGVMK